MSEKIKLGLSRNRLFEFENCVCFLGECEEVFDVLQCRKALKMLCLKESVITACIKLEDDGEAYVVYGGNTPDLELTEGDVDEFLQKKKVQGLDFSKELFSFTILNGNVLCIFAHTVIADVRSLMYLASEFKAFYDKKSFSVESSDNKILSETSQMPSNVFSVVVDRLASGLEVGWQKNTTVFTHADYKKARKKYFDLKKGVNSVSTELDKAVFADLKSFAEKEGVDVSSLVAFAFYRGLCDNVGGKRKYRKLNVQSNVRIFFDDFESMNVGAYNGFFSVEKKKNKNLPDTLINNAKTFHDGIYKKATSAFSAFYNEFLFMRLPPSFADSQYMYCAGLFKHKYSKKLADTYGCASEVLGEFCSYNLAQDYWRGLDGFKKITVSEPLKLRSSSLITFVQKEEEGSITFEYKQDEITGSAASEIMIKAMEILREFK